MGGLDARCGHETNRGEGYVAVSKNKKNKGKRGNERESNTERVSKMESRRTGRGSLYLSIVRDMVNKAGVLTDAQLARGRTQ